jgi:organic radical activating enzyme
MGENPNRLRDVMSKLNDEKIREKINDLKKITANFFDKIEYEYKSSITNMNDADLLMMHLLSFGAYYVTILNRILLTFKANNSFIQTNTKDKPNLSTMEDDIKVIIITETIKNIDKINRMIFSLYCDSL